MLQGIGGTVGQISRCLGVVLQMARVREVKKSFHMIGCLIIVIPGIGIRDHGLHAGRRGIYLRFLADQFSFGD